MRSPPSPRRMHPSSAVFDREPDGLEGERGRVDGYDLHLRVDLWSSGFFSELMMISTVGLDPLATLTSGIRRRVLDDHVIGLVNLAPHPDRMVAEPGERLHRCAPAFGAEVGKGLAVLPPQVAATAISSAAVTDPCPPRPCMRISFNVRPLILHDKSI